MEVNSSPIKKSSRKIYELINNHYDRPGTFQGYHEGMINTLCTADREVFELISDEYDRLKNTIQLVAAENQCSRPVLAALGSIVQNKTTEGFAGQRFHAGCDTVDKIENLAIERAKNAFNAQYANVQPHCGTSANQIVISAVLEKDEKILSLGLEQGGHLSHGAKGTFTKKFFDIENYCLNTESFQLDYGIIREQAFLIRPKLIICGASAYPRVIDFRKFRQIADAVGAYLLADISHISGLIMAKAHPSPIDYAHFTTTSTYKPGGPRGGLILMGADYDKKIKIDQRELSLSILIQKMTFPGFQGTPHLNNIAAKAVFFKEAVSRRYQLWQYKIIENAKHLAKQFIKMGYDVLTGGTDNHMVLINVSNFKRGLTGLIAQKALEDCGMITNMNKLPFDTKNASVTSGLRLGTAIVTKNGMGTEQIEKIARLIDAVLKNVTVINDKEYEIKPRFTQKIKNQVESLCKDFPFN